MKLVRGLLGACALLAPIGCVVYAPAASSPSPANQQASAPQHQAPRPSYSGYQPGTEAWVEPAPTQPYDAAEPGPVQSSE